MTAYTFKPRADGAFNLSISGGTPGEVTPTQTGTTTTPTQGMSFSVTDASHSWGTSTGNAIPISNGTPVVFHVFVPEGYTTIGRTSPPTLNISEQAPSDNLEVHQIVVGQGALGGAFEGNTLQRNIILQTVGDNRMNAFPVQSGDNYIAIYCARDKATVMAASFNGGRA